MSKKHPKFSHELTELFVKQQVNANKAFAPYFQYYRPNNPADDIKYNRKYIDKFYILRDLESKNGKIGAVSYEYDVDNVPGKDIVIFDKRGNVVAVNGLYVGKSSFKPDALYLNRVEPVFNEEKQKYVRPVTKGEYLTNLFNFKPTYNMATGELEDRRQVYKNYNTFESEFAGYQIPRKPSQKLTVRKLLTKMFITPILSIVRKSGVKVNSRESAFIELYIYYNMFVAPTLKSFDPTVYGNMPSPIDANDIKELLNDKNTKILIRSKTILELIRDRYENMYENNAILPEILNTLKSLYEIDQDQMDNIMLNIGTAQMQNM